MKKKSLLLGVFLCLCLGFLLYFYPFTHTDAENLSVSICDENSLGWTVTQLSGDTETTLAPEALFELDGTAVLRRTIPSKWADYDRVSVSTLRAMCVFVDGELVFSNFPTDLRTVSELPLMKRDENQPYSLTFTFQPQWVGKTMTVVTRLYEGEPCYTAGIELVSDEVNMLQREAWANSKALPGAMFGLLSLLLFGLFLFKRATGSKDFSTILLAIAALFQTFIFTSELHGSFWAWNANYFFTGLFFLLSLLYTSTQLTFSQKGFFISTLVIWSVYFALYFSLFHLQLPLPYWFDRSELLCFLPVGILLGCCAAEQKTNRFARLLLRVMGIFLVGYLLLFCLSTLFVPKLYLYFRSIFREALSLYCRPLLFWIYSTILFSLFILAFWESLQNHLQTLQRINTLKLYSSLTEQSLKHAEHTNETLAVARHDELHHLRTLAALCRENPDKAANYAVSLSEEIENIPTMRFTENRLVNAILCVQSDRAAKAAVSFEAKARLPESLPLPEQDVTTVLMNLIDNAIDAAAKTPAGHERRVSVSLTFEEETLLVTIFNSLPAGFDRESFRSGFGKTSKANAERHGYGIRSVQSIVARHGGELAYQADETGVSVNTAMESNLISAM